jgi:hypothetical protein
VRPTAWKARTRHNHLHPLVCAESGQLCTHAMGVSLFCSIWNLHTSLLQCLQCLGTLVLGAFVEYFAAVLQLILLCTQSQPSAVTLVVVALGHSSQASYAVCIADNCTTEAARMSPCLQPDIPQQQLSSNILTISSSNNYQGRQTCSIDSQSLRLAGEPPPDQI